MIVTPSKDIITCALSAHDALTCAVVGVRRRILSTFLKQKQYGNDDAYFDSDIMGAMAEFAVGGALGVFWDGHVGKSDDGDVGGFVEVRMRRVPGTGTDLAIRPKDHDDRPYVLALGHRDFRIEVIGWLYGGDAKARGRASDNAWCESKGVWYVPPPYEPITSLIPIAHEIAQGRALRISVTHVE